MNKSKAKGTAWESQVTAFLRANGFPNVERRALMGNKDCGDIAGIPNWVLECKAEKVYALPEYMREGQCEAENAGVDNFAAIVKRRRANVSEGFVVMPLRIFVPQLKHLVVP